MNDIECLNDMRMLQKIKYIILYLVCTIAFPIFCESAQPYQPVVGDPVLEPWRWQSFPELKDVGPGGVVEDDWGHLWFGVDQELMQFDGNRVVSHQVKTSLPPSRIMALLRTKDKSIYVGTLMGLAGLIDGRWHRIFPVSGEVPFPIYDLIEARDGSLWAASEWGALHLKADGAMLYTSRDKSLALQVVMPELRTVLIPDSLFKGERTTRAGLKTLPSWFPKADSLSKLVWHVTPHGAAEKAGVRVGDRIVALNGHRLVHNNNLRGSEGTQFSLRLERVGLSEPFDVMVDRPTHFEMTNPCVVVSILEGKSGEIWFALHRGELIKLVPQGPSLSAFQVGEFGDGLGLGGNPHIYQSQDGKIWYVSEQSGKSMNVYDGEKWRTIAAKGGAEIINHCLLETRDGTLWIGGRGVLHAIKDGKWHTYKYPEVALPSKRIIAMYESTDGALWIVGQSRVVRLDYETERWLTYHGLQFQTYGKDGSEWFVTEDGNVVRHLANNWTRYDQEDGLMLICKSVVEMQTGVVIAVGAQGKWAATAHFDGQGWEKKIHEGFERIESSRAVFKSPEDILWFGNQMGNGSIAGGVLRFDPTLPKDQAWSHIGAPNFYRSVYTIGQSVDGRTWFGTSRGLSVLKDGVWQPATQPDGLLSGFADVSLTTSKKVFWIAHRINGLFSFDGTVWQHIALPTELLDYGIRALEEAADGSLLVMCDNGVHRFDGQSWYLNIFRFQTLQKTVRSMKSEKGFVWANIDGQTIRYQPDKQAPETQMVDLLGGVEEITFPGNIAFSWQGVDVGQNTPTENLQYSWRLNEEPWAAFDEKVSKTFIHLPDGAYTFQVKARDHNLNEDATPAIAKFVVLPPVYKQTWFLVLIGGLGSIIVVLGVRVLKNRKELIEANAALMASNENLEQRVDDRTQELALSNKQLMYANREMSEVAKVAAHDLAEPLRQVQIFSDLMVRQKDNIEETFQFLTHLKKAAGQIQTRTRDFASYASIAIQSDSFRHVDLDGVLHAVLEDLRFQIESCQANVSWNDLPTVYADEANMKELFFQLVSNGLKFAQSDRSAKIKIEAHMVDDVWQIEVRDNGVGFDMAYADRIFDMFQQIHDREVYEGTGMGLAICRKIVHKHKGHIGVRSKEGQGTTFWVELPSAKML